jgi:tetratricopeptide (TPR) repeat protein
MDAIQRTPEPIANRIDVARRRAVELALDFEDFDPEKCASERADVAKQCNYLGDYETAAAVLSAYLVESHGEDVLNEQALSRIESRRLRADLLVEIGLLMNHLRKYTIAVDLLQKAIELYDGKNAHIFKANAYHWLAFTKLNQHDFTESERCDLKAMELLYQRANQDKRQIGSPGESNLSHAVATSRIWLDILSQRQGLLMKAKAELYTARELMQASFDAAEEVNDPRAWGDLFSTLGRVYSCEGRYEEAIEETRKAIEFYSQAGHWTFEVQTRINLARIYVKRMASPGSNMDDPTVAKRHLDFAAATLERNLPLGDLRTFCLMDLTYSWYYYAREDWDSAAKMAKEAIPKAKKLGSRSLLADCYRAKGDAFIQMHKLREGRRDLHMAMESAEGASQYKTLGAIVLSYARSYCSKVEPDQVEVDKYLDRFIELRSRHAFESRYLEDLFGRIKHARMELPSQRAFYYSIDDLQSAGYDAGLSRYLVWAMRSARLLSHGDMKKMTDFLGFNTLSRTYKYDKIARAVESGKTGAAQGVNKTHKVSRKSKN